ncbi:MAG: type VI secretion system tube protein Hcp [Leptothrix sp. (in: Bacteria)]|nr:type VI secretion system tube protein Hcp [Leptothrix sp. (in: b-proteobacteria)]
MFLKATGQRSGEIVGESNDKNFPNQIDVVDWSWGMSAPTAVGGQRAGRVQLGELKLVKKVDKASTALMSVLNTNEVMPTAVLTVRKAGGPGASLPYFIVKLTQARINTYAVNSTVDETGTPVLMENITFTFKSITIDYTPQSATGGALGASSFTGQAGPD